MTLNMNKLFRLSYCLVEVMNLCLLFLDLPGLSDVVVYRALNWNYPRGYVHQVQNSAIRGAVFSYKVWLITAAVLLYMYVYNVYSM